MPEGAIRDQGCFGIPDFLRYIFRDTAPKRLVIS